MFWNILEQHTCTHLQKKMTIDFYYSPGSAPCRSVLLTAKAIGLDLNLKLVDLRKKEHLTPQFLQINPRHKVPTFVDNGLVLWESRAIVMYLIQHYSKNDALYPKDPKRRTVIDQLIFFDLETLYPCFADCYYPLIFSGFSSPEPEKLAKVQNTFKMLNRFLGSRAYSVGNDLTVADLTLVATVSTYDAMNFDLSPYNNVARWYCKVKATAPGYEEVNEKNVIIFKQMVEALRKK